VNILISWPTSRRSAFAAAQCLPVFKAEEFPGCPPDPLAPPCMRHRLLPVTGWFRHGAPDLVLAPHVCGFSRESEPCMGPILLFKSTPRVHNADYGLRAFVDMDVFDPHVLLALAAVSIQSTNLLQVELQELLGKGVP